MNCPSLPFVSVTSRIATIYYAKSAVSGFVRAYYEAPSTVDVSRCSHDFSLSLFARNIFRRILNSYPLPPSMSLPSHVICKLYCIVKWIVTTWYRTLSNDKMKSGIIIPYKPLIPIGCVAVYVQIFLNYTVFHSVEPDADKYTNQEEIWDHPIGKMARWTDSPWRSMTGVHKVRSICLWLGSQLRKLKILLINVLIKRIVSISITFQEISDGPQLPSTQKALDHGWQRSNIWFLETIWL